MATQFYIRDEVPVALTKGPSLIQMRENHLWETQVQIKMRELALESELLLIDQFDPLQGE